MEEQKNCPKCNSKPTFGHQGNNVRVFCTAHKLNGMIYIPKNKTLNPNKK
jgi:hypothetical protein